MRSCRRQSPARQPSGGSLAIQRQSASRPGEPHHSVFRSDPLRTAKADELQKFAVVVRMMELGRHLTVEGLSDIAAIAETMNHRKPSRFLESSEAIRQPTRVDA